MVYRKMTDEELLDLLYTEKDRLPREGVDEFVGSREEIIREIARKYRERGE